MLENYPIGSIYCSMIQKPLSVWNYVFVDAGCCDGITMVIKDQCSSVVLLACETQEICVDPTLSVSWEKWNLEKCCRYIL
jgi:hypothetical protein